MQRSTFFCIALIQLPKFSQTRWIESAIWVYPKKIWKREKKRGKSVRLLFDVFFFWRTWLDLASYSTQNRWPDREAFSLCGGYWQFASCWIVFLTCQVRGRWQCNLGWNVANTWPHRKASVCVWGNLLLMVQKNPDIQSKHFFFLVTWNSSIKMGSLLRYLYDSVLTRGKLWGGTTRSLPMHRCHNVPRVEVPSLLWDLNFKRWCWTTEKNKQIFGNWNWVSWKSLDFPLLRKIHFSFFFVQDLKQDWRHQSCHGYRVRVDTLQSQHQVFTVLFW